ncbi:MAG: septal ring lytic transglycosylase RlpA family protein [Akkermansiaceae bacterium]
MNKLILLGASIHITLLASCASNTNAELKKKSESVPVSVNKPESTSTAKVLSTEYGIASWYSVKTNYGTKTASGRRLYDSAYTAAHKTLPMGSQVRVTNLSNGRSEKLTITDRGPYVKGRVIDVTIGSGKRLGFYSRGITKVKVQVLKRGSWRYKHP